MKKSFLGILIFFLLIPLVNADPALPTPIGRVVWVKGTFKAIMQNKEERTLKKSSVIYLHDILKTDTKSQAEIILTDKTLMTFKADTTFTFDKYEFKPKAKLGGTGQQIAHLVQGGFRTITGLISKNTPENYQINTPVATIGVRGTHYMVDYREGKFYMGFYEGEPCMRAKGQELCLNDKNRWAGLAPGGKPTVLAQKPEALQEELPITSATIQPFATPTAAQTVPKSGIVNSFCIQ